MTMMQEIDAATAHLTQNGTLGMVPPSKLERLRGVCSFRYLHLTNFPTVAPAQDTALSRYASDELTMLLTRSTRRWNHHRDNQPTIVVDEVPSLIDSQEVQTIPVADEHILSGECPITWLTILERDELRRNHSAWVRGLLEVRSLALNELTAPTGVMVGAYVTPPSSTVGRQTWIAEIALVGCLDEDLEVCARGLVKASLQPGNPFMAERTRVEWFTLRVRWSRSVKVDRPALPASTGCLVIQAAGDPVLRGLAEVTAMRIIRTEAWRHER